jgi:hypothetical protein
VSSAATGRIDADPAISISRAASGAVRLRWDASRFPSVLVRSPVNGEVLSFATGGDATIATAEPQLELVYSNRVRSRRLVRALR